MKKVEFTVDGVDGKFVCDADEVTSYKTAKALALGAEKPSGLYHALERIYMGNDEEYVERVGGMKELARLNDAAAEAVEAKNS